MSTTFLPSLRRTSTAAAVTCALVILTACGAEVTPPKNDIGEAGPKDPLPTFTLEDCLTPGTQPPVTTCPYPVKSGDDFAGTLNRMRHDDEYGAPRR